MVRRRIPAGARSTLFLAALALVALAWLAAGAASAALSNENGRIAFTLPQGSYRDSSSDIWVMNPDGSEKTRLTCDGRSAGPSWSPDGQKIAFGRWGRGAGLWVMDADGRNPTRVGVASGDERWSPTSERLAFPVTVADQLWEVEVLNADGSGGAARGPLDGETLTRQTWSPDGGRLVLQGGWVFDPETGETRYSIGGLQPVWSSRDVIAFVRSGGSNIWTVNPDGSGETQLTDDPDRDGEPLWSPDGQWIAFTRTTRDFHNIDLWAMDADGANQTLLAAGGFAHVWSPDGERIAFLTTPSRRTDDLWVTNADGTDQRRLARGRATGWGVVPLDSHVWSPDGEKIVFAKDYTAGERGGDIWVVNADGSDQTLLAEGADRPDWQPLPPGTSLGPPPSQLCFERVRRNKKRGIARLVVEVPRPGRVVLHPRPGVKRFARAHRDEGTGRAALKARPRGKARQRLNRRNRVRVRAQVTYRPWVGEPRTKRRRVWLVKR